MISAKIVADSISPQKHRLTTLEVVMPRHILAEFNTHRMLSRNSASSRAIPFERMIEAIKTNPFIPMAWGKEHKGMQGTAYYDKETCKEAWLDIDRCFGYPEYADQLAKDYLTKMWLSDCEDAVGAVESMGMLKVTKQSINRMLEPFMWHKVLVSATEWENFFALRCPRYVLESNYEWAGSKEPVWKSVYRSKKDFINNTGMACMNGKATEELTDLDWLKINSGQAEIHMMATAEAIWDAMNESTPKELQPGEWHIPYSDSLNEEAFANQEIVYEPLARVKVATARAARTSYTVVGEESKKANFKNDIILHDGLLKSGHMSPFEHCAKVMSWKEYCTCAMGQFSFDDHDGIQLVAPHNDTRGWSGNFRGFIQYRKMLPNEDVYQGK